MSLKHIADDASAPDAVETSAERRAAIRESLPGLLFGLFTICLTLAGVVLMILNNASRSS